LKFWSSVRFPIFFLCEHGCVWSALTSETCWKAKLPWIRTGCPAKHKTCFYDGPTMHYGFKDFNQAYFEHRPQEHKWGHPTRFGMKTAYCTQWQNFTQNLHGINDNRNFETICSNDHCKHITLFPARTKTTTTPTNWINTLMASIIESPTGLPLTIVSRSCCHPQQFHEQSNNDYEPHRINMENKFYRSRIIDEKQSIPCLQLAHAVQFKRKNKLLSL
jgi:hypothetical protein